MNKLSLVIAAIVIVCLSVGVGFYINEINHNAIEECMIPNEQAESYFINCEVIVYENIPFTLCEHKSPLVNLSQK